MKNKRKKLFIFNAAVGQIFLLISMSFAFSILMSREVHADPVPGTSVTINNVPAVLSPDKIKELGVDLTPSEQYIPGTTTTPIPVSPAVSPAKVPFDPSAPVGTYNAPKNPITGKPMFGSSPVAGSLFTGLMWSAMVVGLIQLGGNLFGADKSLTNSLSYAAFGGIMAGSLVKGLLLSKNMAGVKNVFTLGGKITSASTSGWIVGGVVAIAIFIATYKKEKKDLVKYECMPFEPELGGKKCEECNKDPFRPCTEYRCRSLGQSCRLLNEGTNNVTCVWLNEHDVTTPKIIPQEKTLAPVKLNLHYTPLNAVRPDKLGSKIVVGTDGCLPAYTALEFGFDTNEPAQCKLDYNHTQRYEDMTYYVGETNYYLYNHTQKMRLPGGDAMAPLLQNDGTFGLFVRCMDGNGNAMVDEYEFNFCVQKGPDTTPVNIEGFSIPSGSYINFDNDNLSIEMYANEPADCKWSIQSKNYEDMENTMSCASESYEINADLVYTCETKLTGIKNREDNTFYFRCKDQPELAGTGNESQRNVNVQSTPYVIKGSQPLDILTALPNGTVITGSTDIVPVNIEIETSNGAEENGNATCMISTNATEDNFISMYETNSYIHKQTYTLGNGNYFYYIRCFDAGGNAADSNVSFTVYVDKAAPDVTRMYKEEGLKIVTNEDAECVFSTSTCNYQIKDGQKMIYAKADVKNNHYAEWKENGIYYIKCFDGYGNQPDPSKCSAVVRALDLIKTESNK